MNKWVYIIWLVVLLGGGLVKGILGKPKPDADIYKATIDLPKDHQLKETDLVISRETAPHKPSIKLDSLVGQHLKMAKKANDTIKIQDLNPFPVFPEKNDSNILMLPLLKEEFVLSEWIKPGVWIELCSVNPNEKAVDTFYTYPVKVVAIHRSTQKAPGDFLLLQLSGERSKEISHFITAKHRFILMSLK